MNMAHGCHKINQIVKIWQFFGKDNAQIQINKFISMRKTNLKLLSLSRGFIRSRGLCLDMKV